jgi:hypothetical protein
MPTPFLPLEEYDYFAQYFREKGRDVVELAREIAANYAETAAAHPDWEWAVFSKDFAHRFLRLVENTERSPESVKEALDGFREQLPPLLKGVGNLYFLHDWLFYNTSESQRT